MTTATTTYRAQTDPTTKKWHLGSDERGTLSFCGVRLVDPTDTRAFALKVAEADRHIETSADLERVTCGACRRNHEWKYAHGTERPAPRAPRAPRTPAPAPRPRAASGEGAAAAKHNRNGLTGTEAARMAAEAAEANGDAAKPPSQRKRRQSRADKAHAAQERDRAKLAASADAAVAAIDAAVGTATGEAPLPKAVPSLTRAQQARRARGKGAKTGHPAADRAANADAPEADLPGSAAGHRDEAGTCERGTPGCSVRHTRDSECATW